MAFAWLVATAAWKQTRVRYKGHDIVLERGQLTISIRDFAERLDRPKGWAERLFARLREHGMIDQKNGTQVGTQVGTHGGTVGGTAASVITICNYGEYQAEALFDETVRETPNKTRPRQARDTEQEREEEKNISSEPKGSSPRAWSLYPGVSLQVWDDLKRNRSKKRLQNTETAWKGFLEDVQRVASQTGIPPPELIRRCVAKGWGAIYDPRTERNERSNNPTAEAVHRILGSSGAYG
jgi:hypothetical protein